MNVRARPGRRVSISRFLSGAGRGWVRSPGRAPEGPCGPARPVCKTPAPLLASPLTAALFGAVVREGALPATAGRGPPALIHFPPGASSALEWLYWHHGAHSLSHAQCGICSGAPSHTLSHTHRSRPQVYTHCVPWSFHQTHTHGHLCTHPVHLWYTPRHSYTLTPAIAYHSTLNSAILPDHKAFAAILLWPACAYSQLHVMVSIMYPRTPEQACHTLRHTLLACSPHTHTHSCMSSLALLWIDGWMVWRPFLEGRLDITLC